MKILRVVANNYKRCSENFTIDFVAHSKKSQNDKEYELHEIEENLFVFNTLAFLGRNASGKTTAVEILAIVYDMFNGRSALNPANHGQVMHEIVPKSLRPKDWWEVENMILLTNIEHYNAHNFNPKEWKQKFREIWDKRYSEIYG